LLVIPAAVARNLTNHIRGMLVVSTGVAMGSTLAGLELSYQIDLPSGATIVIILALLFFLAILRGRQRSK
jgi:ABC-type Mn2+/Zn2+ transport system permease subunit